MKTLIRLLLYSEDPDQTAPLGAVWSGSALFAQTHLSKNFRSLRLLSTNWCRILLSAKAWRDSVLPLNKLHFYLPSWINLTSYWNFCHIATEEVMLQLIQPMLITKMCNIWMRWKYLTHSKTSNFSTLRQEIIIPYVMIYIWLIIYHFRLRRLNFTFTISIWLKADFYLWNNYNCHNIYRCPLIWLVKNGHLIVLTCISFFNELLFVFMRGGDIHGRTSFLILCNASMKRNGQSATTYTLLYTYADIFRWKNNEELTYDA